MNTLPEYHSLRGQEAVGTEPGDSVETALAQWDGFVAQAGLPIREHHTVVSVEHDAGAGEFTVMAQSNEAGVARFRARSVVSCVGNYAVPRIPEFDVPASVKQLHIGTYRSPDALPADEAVLVVGTGQSGVQIAEELAVSGRNVFVATSANPGVMRTYRGEDIFHWLKRIGFFLTPKDNLPPEQRADHRVPIVGATHAISPFSLARQGATLLGRLADVRGSVARFDDSLKANVEFMLATYNSLPPLVEAWIAANGDVEQFPPVEPEPEWDPLPELLTKPPILELDLEAERIGTIVWTTGWRANFSWLRVPAALAEFAEHGTPDRCDSRAVPGLYFLGHEKLRTRFSVNVHGIVQEDAPFVSQCIVERNAAQ